MTTTDNALGLKLKRLREQHSNSQADLANMLNVKAQTYSAYERGISLPDVNSLVVLADYFEVTTDFLLGRSEFPKSEYHAENINNSVLAQGSNACATVSQPTIELSVDEIELVSIFRKCNAKQRHEMMSVAFNMEVTSE
jgi:transcriptional regulator with XRE-family HTH domain